MDIREAEAAYKTAAAEIEQAEKELAEADKIKEAAMVKWAASQSDADEKAYEKAAARQLMKSKRKDLAAETYKRTKDAHGAALRRRDELQREAKGTYLSAWPERLKPMMAEFIAIDEKLDALTTQIAEVVADAQTARDAFIRASNDLGMDSACVEPTLADARRFIRNELTRVRETAGRPDPARWLASVPPEHQGLGEKDLAAVAWRKSEEARLAREAAARNTFIAGANAAIRDLAGKEPNGQPTNQS